MFKKALTPLVAVALIVTGSTAVLAQGMMNAMHGSGIFSHMRTGPDHGMPTDTMGGDGMTYTGAPNLQIASSLVAAGGPAGHFSITRALTQLGGAKTANAEVGKLTRQYGSARVGSYVTVQNYAVDDAVRIATAAGVKFPASMMRGAGLAKQVVMAGLYHGTYYEGTMLDRVVGHKIHEMVMDDIDKKYGAHADANYHLISNQAHYDLAHALGATSVGLAAYH